MKNKKLKITLIIIFSAVLLAVACYVGYGLTLINPNSTDSIVRHLTVDKDNPAEILSVASLDDCACIIYLEKAYGDVSYARVGLTKSKFYLNRYKIRSSGHSNYWGEERGLTLCSLPDNLKIEGTDKERVYFFVYGITYSEVPYSVVYTDENGNQEVIYSSTAYAQDGNYLEMFYIDVDSAVAQNYDAVNMELII
ncbi:MAG: hypothetical protein LUH82_04885 [Clostridiales bacterium]|nr:hypothetical protein [Clostridiales bacterium]